MTPHLLLSLIVLVLSINGSQSGTGFHFAEYPDELYDTTRKEAEAPRGANADGNHEDPEVETVADEEKAEEAPDAPLLEPLTDVEGKVEEGRRSYRMLEKQSSNYGVCWKLALSSLHMGCKRLDEDTQARLALGFTNCFLDKTGFEGHHCEDLVDMRGCLKNMSDKAFHAYTHFFTHTQSICFFLSNQLWQEKTEDTISRLTSTSAKVTESLNELQDMQQKSIDSQSLLNNEILDSRVVLEEFKHSLREKSLIESEILNRFMEVKNFVLSEVSKYYTVAFYVLAIIVAYLMTTSPMTRSARIWLFLLFAVNGIVERAIVSVSLSDQFNATRNMVLLSYEIDHNIYLCRCVTSIMGILILAWFALNYKDYERINYNLLNEIKQQTNELKQLHYLGMARNSSTSSFEKNTESGSGHSSSSVSGDSDFSSAGESDLSDDMESTSTAFTGDVSSTTIDKSNARDSLASNVLALPENVSSPLDPFNFSASSEGRYNLRPRKATMFIEKDIEETPSEFAAYVQIKALNTKLRRNYVKKAVANEANEANKSHQEVEKQTFFSSDEDI